MRPWRTVPFILFLLTQEMKDQCDQKRYKLYLELYHIYLITPVSPSSDKRFLLLWLQRGIWNRADSLHRERTIKTFQSWNILPRTTASVLSRVPRGRSIIHISLEIIEARSILKYFDTGCSSSCCSGTWTLLHRKLLIGIFAVVYPITISSFFELSVEFF
jgi:hypothetical protein